MVRSDSYLRGPCKAQRSGTHCIDSSYVARDINCRVRGSWAELISDDPCIVPHMRTEVCHVEDRTVVSTPWRSEGPGLVEEIADHMRNLTY